MIEIKINEIAGAMRHGAMGGGGNGEKANENALSFAGEDGVWRNSKIQGPSSRETSITNDQQAPHPPSRRRAEEDHRQNVGATCRTTKPGGHFPVVDVRQDLEDSFVFYVLVQVKIGEVRIKTHVTLGKNTRADVKNTRMGPICVFLTHISGNFLKDLEHSDFLFLGNI